MILLKFLGPIMPRRFTKIKSIRRQEKDEIEHKIVSRLTGFIDFSFSMNGFILVQRTFTYDGNLIGKSLFTFPLL